MHFIFHIEFPEDTYEQRMARISESYALWMELPDIAFDLELAPKA